MWFGFGLVLVGVLLLLNNLGIIKGDTWGYIWPAAIILFGLNILFGKKDKGCCPPQDNQGDKKEAK